MGDALSDVLVATEAERLATGFQFTEGPLWHPEGFYFTARTSIYALRVKVPGQPHPWYLTRSRARAGQRG
jgi:hypothetical protein